MNGLTRIDAVKHAACALVAVCMIVACGWMINEVLISPMSPWAGQQASNMVSYQVLAER